MLFSGLSSPHIHESARGILIGGMYLLAQVATFLGWLLGSQTSQSFPSLSITSQSKLSCGSISHPITSGYVHLEGGNLFFSLIEAKESARNNGLVIYFEGGPGGSAMDYPFLGAGPCQLTPEGGTTLSPAPYPWTDHANLLVLEYPIPTGWSYNTTFQVPHDSSAGAAEDFDDFLQALLHYFPQFVHQPLIISSLSYGGTTATHMASTVLQRNQNAEMFSTRIKKQIDQLVLGNPFGDVVTVVYQNLHHLCYTPPAILPASSCETLKSYLTPCLDRLAFLTSESTSHLSTRELRLEAAKYCAPPFELTWKDARVDRYDNRKPPCWPVGTCWWWNDSLRALMNSDEMKEIFGVPSHLTWGFLGLSSLYFYLNADNMQTAYHLLPAVIDAGTRIFVYSGMNDTILPYEGSLVWMSRIPSSQLSAFRQPPITIPSPAGPLETAFRGIVHNPGGAVTLYGFPDAGHMAQADQPTVVWKILENAVKGKNWNPLEGWW
ncbi:serine carboxypeptidase-like 33 [Cryptococcus neoformans]|nr:serine carboxypeptidase-like 33 [Cryptococcus neoformans var. grubii]